MTVEVSLSEDEIARVTAEAGGKPVLEAEPMDGIGEVVGVSRRNVQFRKHCLTLGPAEIGS